MKVHQQHVKDLLQEVDASKVVIATKYTDIEGIEILESLGIRMFGENRVQDFLSKYEQYRGKGEFHFIGTLQTNKVKYIIDKVALIHSVDHYALIDEIDRQAKKHHQVKDILIQMNIAQEESKHGFNEEDIDDVVDYVETKEFIRGVGFMMMAPHIEATQTRIYFKRMKQCLERVQKAHPQWAHLSMGMSNDYPIALEEGATYIRVGRKVFE